MTRRVRRAHRSDKIRLIINHLNHFNQIERFDYFWAGAMETLSSNQSKTQFGDLLLQDKIKRAQYALSNEKTHDGEALVQAILDKDIT